jgi:hypothetical protein
MRSAEELIPPIACYQKSSSELNMFHASYMRIKMEKKGSIMISSQFRREMRRGFFLAI